MSNPFIVFLGAFGIVLNLLFSGGTLFKLIEFAKEWGVTKEKIRTHDEEINRLREFAQSMRDGKIPIVHVHKGG